MRGIIEELASDPKILLAALIVLLVAALLWLRPWQPAGLNVGESAVASAAGATGIPSSVPAVFPTASSVSPVASAFPYQNQSPETVDGQLEVLRMPGCNESYDVSAKVAACMNRTVVAIIPIRDAEGCIVDVTC